MDATFIIYGDDEQVRQAIDEAVDWLGDNSMFEVSKKVVHQTGEFDTAMLGPDDVNLAPATSIFNFYFWEEQWPLQSGIAYPVHPWNGKDLSSIAFIPFNAWDPYYHTVEWYKRTILHEWMHEIDFWLSHYGYKVKDIHEIRELSLSTDEYDWNREFLAQVDADMYACFTQQEAGGFPYLLLLALAPIAYLLLRGVKR